MVYCSVFHSELVLVLYFSILVRSRFGTFIQYTNLDILNNKYFMYLYLLVLMRRLFILRFLYWSLLVMFSIS